MDIRFQNLGPEHWKGEVLLAPACQGETLLEQIPELDKVAPWLVIAPAMRDFKGKQGELTLIHGHTDLAVPRVLADPRPGVLLTAFAADGLELTIGFWIGDPEKGMLNVRSEVNLAVLRLLQDSGVEIPFPQRVVRSAGG